MLFHSWRFFFDPHKKYYQAVNIQDIFNTFFPAILLGLVGIFWLREMFLLSPLVTLLCLFLINLLMKPALGRKVYLMMKGDYLPADRQSYEMPVAVIIMLCTFFIPIELNSILFHWQAVKVRKTQSRKYSD